MYDARVQKIWARLVAARPAYREVSVATGETSSFKDNVLTLSRRYEGLPDDAIAYAMTSLVLIDFLGRHQVDVEPKIHARVASMGDVFSGSESTWGTFKSSVKVLGLVAGLVWDVGRSAARVIKDVRHGEAAQIRDAMAWVHEAGLRPDGAVAYFAYWAEQPDRRQGRGRKLTQTKELRVLQFANDGERVNFARDVAREFEGEN